MHIIGPSLGIATMTFFVSTSLQGAPAIPQEYRIGGFAVGCQAYTFNRFSVFEAIEKTAQAGGRVIEFYPGQKLSQEQPDIKWDHNVSDEVIQKVKDQLAKHDILGVGYGVVGISKNEGEARKVFEFAKKMGLYAVTTESDDALDSIEKLVKEYDIRVAFHEHRRQADNPNYKLWDPNYVLSIVKNRDRRIGACADTGHWATSGINPLDGIKILRGRIIICHLKERTAIGKELPDTIYGTGVTDTRGILDELKRQRFEGNISIEYENNWDNSVPDVAQCIGFIRGYTAR
jgi:sugar phosphate isomerase/epimerase